MMIENAPSHGMDKEGYELLADVLQRAYHQAAYGKGNERHANGEPFDQQVVMDMAKRFGVGSPLGQAFKKSEESQRLPRDRAVAELLGAIVYLAAAVIHLERSDVEVAEKQDAERAAQLIRTLQANKKLAAHGMFCGGVVGSPMGKEVAVMVQSERVVPETPVQVKVSLESAKASKLDLQGMTEISAGRLMSICHQASYRAGWWTKRDGTDERDDPKTFSQKLMLVVSELAEAMEGDRKDMMDDKLPHRKMREVELADALIRIFDLAGAYGMDIGGAMAEKLAYNRNREDHKPENRQSAGGKAY